MIIAHIFGGLGNQMFQYATGRSLALYHNTNLKLDTHPLTTKGITPRTYRLSNLSVTAEVATDDEIKSIRSYFNRNVYNEKHFSYDSGIYNTKLNTYLNGYWQSEKYFKDIRSILLSEFTLKEKPDALNQEMAEQIKSCESVSIHVRRGDYVTDPTTNAYHGVCPIEYYKETIQTIKKKVQDPEFFIFSDDPKWCWHNINIGYPTTIIDFNGPNKDYADLRLMSLCRHHIIANSSFSWWGAWLCENPEKTVIAPKRWFIGAHHDTKDLLPGEWVIQ